MHEVGTLLRRELRVRYPAGRGRILLRTELDWDRNLEPIAVDDDGATSIFLLETRRPDAIVLATVLALAGGHAILYGVQAALIPELFGTRLRCTGASIGYQLAAPIAGGLAPLIAAVLVRQFPGQYWPLAAYVVLIAAVSLACVHRLAETSQRDLSESDRSADS